MEKIQQNKWRLFFQAQKHHQQMKVVAKKYYLLMRKTIIWHGYGREGC